MFSVIEFIFPTMVNILAITGLTAAVVFLLFRSYILSLYTSVGRKRFIIVMIVTLILMYSIVLLSY